MDIVNEKKRLTVIFFGAELGFRFCIKVQNQVRGRG
jgi:hypothetical protein